MASTFAFLRDVRPYKTSWRVQVKVLHSWRQYTQSTGETLEMVFADEMGTKIHSSVKNDLLSKYVNKVHVGNWLFVETFGLSYATGQFRPTGHLYKMSFLTGTLVMPSEPKSDSHFLSLAKFHRIQNGELNPYIFIDVMGQIVSIGELQNLEANNKPTTKVDLELRDETDKRMTCTLWGAYADRVFRASQESDGSMMVCLLRFVKIKSYKGVTTLSNAFDTTQIHVNPALPEVESFKQSLPSDGLSLIFRETQPKWDIVTVNTENYLDFPRKTLSELKHSLEIGMARLLCTVYAIDTDWAWYYISCRACNKKVQHINDGVNVVNNNGKKPRFWCDVCKTVVTSVVPKFMIYADVMDNTGEAKLLLFDSVGTKLIGETATIVLDGKVDEIVDPENLPGPLKNLCGKTFLFLVCVEKENIWGGKEIYKVSKVLVKDGLVEEQMLQSSSDMVNATSIVSGDQGPLLLGNSPETTSSITPSSKRVYAISDGTSEQSSTSKKLCIKPMDLEKKIKEIGDQGIEVSNVDSENEKKKGVVNEGAMKKSDSVGMKKMVGVKIKVEKKE